MAGRTAPSTPFREADACFTDAPSPKEEEPERWALSSKEDVRLMELATVKDKEERKKGEAKLSNMGGLRARSRPKGG